MWATLAPRHIPLKIGSKINLEAIMVYRRFGKDIR